MATTDLANYRTLYLQTAKEYIEKMSVGLSQLSFDISNKQALNNIHISSHSLKSQSQVMGFTDMASLSAVIEKSSNDILNGVSQIDDKFIAFLKTSVAELSLGLTKIKTEMLK